MVAEHIVPLARERLSEDPIPSCYLRGHTVGLVGKHGAFTKNATRGCSQGSILLDPSLWNLVFDDLLHTLGRRGVRAVAYTDDLLIIISGNSRVQIETAGQTAIGIIEEWCGKEKLSPSRRRRPK